MRRRFKRWLDNKRRQRDLRRRLATMDPIRLIIGAAATSQTDWLSTEREDFDLLEPSGWRSYVGPASVQAILAEHVWEHLTPEQGRLAAQTCYTFLRPGGHLRCAVPDGNHPSPDYIEHVRPGGSGIGADDHKVLYMMDTFSALFESVGFETRVLEAFDSQHEFHHQPWSSDDGHIMRSRDHDRRNTDGQLHYTSLIIDAIKPSTS